MCTNIEQHGCCWFLLENGCASVIFKQNFYTSLRVSRENLKDMITWPMPLSRNHIPKTRQHPLYIPMMDMDRKWLRAVLENRKLSAKRAVTVGGKQDGRKSKAMSSVSSGVWTTNWERPSFSKQSCSSRTPRKP